MPVDRIMTPSGRMDTQWGNPPGRPPGPTQHLIPVGPPPTVAGVPVQPPTVMRSARTGIVRDVTQSPSAHQALVGLPRLNTPFVDPLSGAAAIPWTQFITNLWRLAQPTGIVPGVYAGITFNVFGQAISGQASGFTLDSPVLTGTPTAPTPPISDNSTRIATTAFVVSYVGAQGFITGVALSGDVIGSGASAFPTTVVGLQHIPVSAVPPLVGQVLGFNGAAWTPTPTIGDAPSDGQFYARQNGQWVRLSIAVLPPT